MLGPCRPVLCLCCRQCVAQEQEEHHSPWQPQDAASRCCKAQEGALLPSLPPGSTPLPLFSVPPPPPSRHPPPPPKPFFAVHSCRSHALLPACRHASGHCSCNSNKCQGAHHPTAFIVQLWKPSAGFASNHTAECQSKLCTPYPLYLAFHLAMSRLWQISFLNKKANEALPMRSQKAQTGANSCLLSESVYAHSRSLTSID